MFTAPVSTDNNDRINQDRKQFLGEVDAYDATHNAEASRVALFVFAASAAVYAEQQTIKASEAELPVPVIASATAPTPPATFQVAPVTLTSTGQLDPSFVVPAAYFYVLSVSFPFQLSAQQRYDANRANTEIHLVDEFQTALDQGIIPAKVSPLTSDFSSTRLKGNQAARRIVALANNVNPLSVRIELSGTDFKYLVQDWLAYDDETTSINENF